MSDKMDKVLEKIEKIENKLSSIHDVQIVQHKTLEEHMRRSEANEKAVEILQTKMETDMGPIKDHVKAVNQTLKILGIVLSGVFGLLTFIVGVIQIVKFFR